jgi:formylglycine-generating enzyme required for sulfatase activity
MLIVLWMLASFVWRMQAPEGMVLVPGGAMLMGIDRNEFPHFQQVFGIKNPQLFEDEIPKHTVILDSFYIDKELITNARFKEFVDRNPAWSKDAIPAELHNSNYLKEWSGTRYPDGKADHPVVNVNWQAAVAYCRWRSKRLPTEAEWELAARGVLRSPVFAWGDDPPDTSRANYAASGLKTTTPVGKYPPNGLGLFDISGNVWEFTADEWRAYSSGDSTNPVAGGDFFESGDSYLTITTRRVIRGGSWGGAPVNLWVEYRDSHPPDGAQEFVGFRCARSAF